MSRKVDLKVEVEVLVPMRVILGIQIRAEEGVNIDRFLKRWAANTANQQPNVDVETIDVLKVVSINGQDPDDLENSLVDRLHEGKKLSVILSEVIDSR